MVAMADELATQPIHSLKQAWLGLKAQEPVAYKCGLLPPNFLPCWVQVVCYFGHQAIKVDKAWSPIKSPGRDGDPPRRLLLGCHIVDFVS